MIITPGATSQTITVQMLDDSGLAVTGLIAGTFPTTSYERTAEALVGITLSDLAAITSAYSSGGVKEVGGGYYRLDVPDAAFATASRVRIVGEATGKHLLYPPITCGKLAATLGSGDYSGNTVQTGDAFGRLGTNGAGLTALGDTRLANLDASILSRLATSGYVAPDNADVVSALADLVTLLARNTPLDAAGVRTALGLASANLDVQIAEANADLDELITTLGAPVLSDLSHDIASRLATSGYTVPANPSDYARNNIAPSWWTAPDNADIVTAVADLVTLLARTDSTTALTAIKAVTDHLATMINGTPQFTATALALAPAGGSGSAPSAAAVAAEVDTVLSGTHGAGEWGAASAAVLYGESGEFSVTIDTFDTDGVSALEGCSVFVSRDSVGVNRSQAKLSDASGRVTFTLDAGLIYIWRSRVGRTFDNPESGTVG